MSLARRHRESILANRDAAADAPNDGVAHVSAADPSPAAETTILVPETSLARRHVAGILAAQDVAAVQTGEAADLSHASPADRAAAQMALRLTHDLRRLKEIKSVAAKVEAKRGMLPEYAAWVEGVLTADAGVGNGVSADIVPTVMVWLIDTGSYMAALDMLPFLLRHDVAMPSRYNRDAATIAVEEIADAAMKAQATGETFPLDILTHVADLTDGIDMHDEVRAKLAKAIGSEQLRALEEGAMTFTMGGAIHQALHSLRQAHSLHDRVGVKDRIKRAEKLQAAYSAAFPPAPANTDPTEQGGDSAA